MKKLTEVGLNTWYSIYTFAYKKKTSLKIAKIVVSVSKYTHFNSIVSNFIAAAHSDDDSVFLLHKKLLDGGRDFKLILPAPWQRSVHHVSNARVLNCSLNSFVVFPVSTKLSILVEISFVQ